MEYGRNVSEAEVKKAEFLNFLRAPKEIQTAMSRFDPSSSGYNKMQNLAASARYDAEQANARSGAVRQVGTDGVIRNIAGSGGGATDGQVNRAFAERLPPELTRALSPQGDADRAARRAERQPRDPGPSQAERSANTPTYRGMPGVGLGSVNGQAELYPIAGQSQAFSQSMGAFGLPGTDGVSQARFEGARSGMVAQQERGRRGQRFEGQKAARQSAAAAAIQRQQELDDKILLETIKNNGINAPGIQDWMQDLGRVRKEQQAYDEIAAAVQGKQPDEPVQIGQEFRTVGEWRKMIAANPRPETPTYENWRGGQAHLGDPRFAGGGAQAASGGKARRQQAFAQLTPERRAIYNGWSADQKEAYWNSVGL